MKTDKFDVIGMTCASCVAHVENSVTKIPGIQQVEVNLLTNSMTVRYDESAVSHQNIEQAVHKVGYEAFLRTSSSAKVQNPETYAEREMDEMKRRFWYSLLFLLPLLYLSMGSMLHLPLPTFFIGHEHAVGFAFTQFLLSSVIMLINNKYFVVGYKTLFKGAPNMDSLIALGTSAAFGYGIYAIFQIGFWLGQGDGSKVMHFTHDLYFESGATILTLITLGKFLEAKSKHRTTDAIQRLMNLAPKSATVIRNGEECEVAVGELLVDDCIIIKSGDSIPVDGVIIEGSGDIDESAITGESLPVYKTVGSQVISATINKTGHFVFQAKRVGEDTTLAQITRLVEEASASKAPISKLADQISRIFVPVVIIIALLSAATWLLLGYSFDTAFSFGIAVLVISCPCALGLATPLAIMVGTGKGAEHGILIKSAEALETAHQIDTVVLDKTGTITEGKPQITNFVVAEGFDEKEVLSAAYALEQKSEHPLAKAVVEEAQRRACRSMPCVQFEVLPGKGVQAYVNDRFYRIGNAQWMKENAVALGEFSTVMESLTSEGKTPLLMAEEARLIALFAVADTIKSDSQEAVVQLRSMGLNVVMLTGDHQSTAEYIQRQVHIPTVIAELLPHEKEREVRRLQDLGQKVAMVGDGINDAPALSRADVGIAIGAGTDVAIESADVVLIRSSLSDVVSAIRLSKAVMLNIKQNLFWAFFYNIIGIPLAAGLFYVAWGWRLNPMFAAVAMSLSSITVVLNALRLMRFQHNLPKGMNQDSLSQEQNVKFETIRNTTMMKKTVKISGMSCGHCSARVEKALNAIEGVEAKVDLSNQCAEVHLSKEVSDEEIKQAIENSGYEVTEIVE